MRTELAGPMVLRFAVRVLLQLVGARCGLVVVALSGEPEEAANLTEK